MSGQSKSKPKPPLKTTVFSAGLDQLARREGGWSRPAVVHTIECVNASQVLLTGGVPTGHRRDGYPKFDRKGDAFKAVVSIEDYRAAIAKATSPTP